MSEINLQLLVWLILSFFIVVFSLWAIVDGIKDFRWMKYQRLRDLDVRAMLIRHIRNATFIFVSSNLAGFTGTLLLLGIYQDNTTLFHVGTVMLPFVINFILGTYLVILVWNRIDRARLINRKGIWRE